MALREVPPFFTVTISPSVLINVAGMAVAAVANTENAKTIARFFIGFLGNRQCLLVLEFVPNFHLYRKMTFGETMKTSLALLVLFASTVAASAQYGTGSNSNSHTIRPYTTQSGTSVGGSHATNRNTTQTDNYGTKGNVNPYTGTVGTGMPKY